jgi:hypothetical protein
VSAANEKKASDMLDRALGLSTARDDEAAEELVRKAYQLDPNIRFDNYKRGIVTQVMGGNTDDAFARLDRGIGGTQKEKSTRKNSDRPDSVSWGTAITDLVIYGLVTATVVIVGLIIAIQVGRPYALSALEQQMAMNEFTYRDANGVVTTFSSSSPLELVNGLLNVGIGLAIAYGAFVGIVTIIGTIISCGAIHIAATMILGGVGTLRGLIHKLVPFYTVITVISVIFGFVFGAVSISELANMPETDFTMESSSDFSDEEFEMMFSSYYQPSPIAQILQAISSLGSLAVWIYSVQLIAQAYDFSWLRGCFAQFIGSILLSFALCGCIMLFGTAITSSIMSMSSQFVTSMP